MIGMSAEYTCHLNTVPSTMYDSTHVKTGSAALTVCANETAPAPSEMTAPAWPSAWAAPMGMRTFQPFMSILGALRMPEAQSRQTHGIPTKSETTVMVHGIGKAFWHFLLVMLYMTLRKNHVKKRKPSWAVSTTLRDAESLPAGHEMRVHSSMASSSMHGASATGVASAAAASSMTKGAMRRAAASCGRATPATGVIAKPETCTASAQTATARSMLCG
mmetsp:Transcript_47672/g.125956  ORF Transcript_47672/g.125956 Transcript_47672/m.125956 type:complete len:218 (-) Transcript_47672:16-669(-)